MTPEQRSAIYLTIFGAPGHKEESLAAITQDRCWDSFEIVPSAKAIGFEQWKSAFMLTMLLDKIVPGLPPPTPGADKHGFIWLTWRSSNDNSFALEIHSDLTKDPYRWTMIRNGVPQSHSGKDPRALVESLRATLGDTERDRQGLRMVETHHGGV